MNIPVAAQLVIQAVAKLVYFELGYRSLDKDNQDIEIKHWGKDKQLTDEERRQLKNDNRSS